MNNHRTKFLFFAISLAILLVLSGCGLNQRSASQSEPVPVEPIDVNVTDPAVDPPENEEPAPAEGDNSGENSDNADPNANEGEAADPTQPAGGEGEENQDPNTQPETPVEDPPADPPAEDGENQDPNAEPPANEEEPAAEPDSPSADTNGKHTVQAGQTLFSIAQQYGLTVQELAAANGIVNPNVLDVGQELVIPVAGTVQVPDTASVHVVSYGDTIYSIALRYGVTVEELALHNELANVNRIDVGQEIKIPSGAGK